MSYPCTSASKKSLNHSHRYCCCAYRNVFAQGLDRLHVHVRLVRRLKRREKEGNVVHFLLKKRRKKKEKKKRSNICIIKNGKPEIRYVTVKDHPTCIRSMDVRILGVAGGSMVGLDQNG